jgi:hypothetical protein
LVPLTAKTRPPEVRHIPRIGPSGNWAKIRFPGVRRNDTISPFLPAQWVDRLNFERCRRNPRDQNCMVGEQDVILLKARVPIGRARYENLYLRPGVLAMIGLLLLLIVLILLFILVRTPDRRRQMRIPLVGLMIFKPDPAASKPAQIIILMLIAAVMITILLLAC